jgi:hypothetical protein
MASVSRVVQGLDDAAGELVEGITASVGYARVHAGDALPGLVAIARPWLFLTQRALSPRQLGLLCGIASRRADLLSFGRGDPCCQPAVERGDSIAGRQWRDILVYLQRSERPACRIAGRVCACFFEKGRRSARTSKNSTIAGRDAA